MSDDEMADGIRRSPRKGSDGQPVMAADAARNILQNKKTPRGTKRDPPEKMPVGTKAAPKKKGKTTPIPDEEASVAEDDDANNFEPHLHTERENKKLVAAQKLVEAQQGLVKAVTGKKSDAILMRDRRRNEPDKLKAAAKKKHDQEVYDQKLNDEETQASRMSSPRTDDNLSEEDATTKKKTPSTHSASKKTPIKGRAHKDQVSRNPLCRTGSMSSENASSVNDSPHSNLDPSPNRAVGGGRKSGGGGLTHHQTTTTKRECSGRALSRPLTTLHPVRRVGHQYHSCTG